MQLLKKLPPHGPLLLPLHTAISFKSVVAEKGMQADEEEELQSREEREEGMEGKEEVGLFAPVSTTGILGLIIQMWMLLLENTRSRVEALSSTWDQRQTLFSRAQWQTLINV